MISVGEQTRFLPLASVFPDTAAPECRTCVAIPACNEEKSLRRCLEALQHQEDCLGNTLPQSEYEVLLLLNNCTDGSRQIAEAVQKSRPGTRLLWAECNFAPNHAHAGSARKLLMDTAWHRLRAFQGRPGAAILTSDADSAVAPDWIARNLAALDAGADAVGGAVKLFPGDLAALPRSVQSCYGKDRRYAELIAVLEDLLDPQEGDRLPRHLDHFGSSLACSRVAYAKAGGLPALPSLEDEGFVDRLRRAELRLRHDPDVIVFTSARIEGRAMVGMAGQLRLWSELTDERDHVVRSAGYLVHRFRLLRALRLVFTTKKLERFSPFTAQQRQVLLTAVKETRTIPSFLESVDCDALVEHTFKGKAEQPIDDAIYDLEAVISTISHLTGALQHGDAIARTALIREERPFSSMQPEIVDGIA